MKPIHILNAHLHNLKNLTLDIPRGQLVAITGVSGSGKSTLAFDLIFAEGRRRYLQSIGMISDLVEETGCDRISGLGPTIAVQQGIIRNSNPRSSVGTRTGIFTFLRMLYVYEGRHACPGCGKAKRASEACTGCGNPAEGLHSGYFSYNSPQGMCLRCQGRGHLFELNMEKLLPTPQTTLRQVLINAECQVSFQGLLGGIFKNFADLPFNEAPASVQQHLLHGLPVGEGRVSRNLFDHLRWRLLKGREVNDCILYTTCPVCGGYRLCQEALQVTLSGCHLGQISRFTLADVDDFLASLAVTGELSPFGVNLVGEIHRQLTTLSQNGLGHLTLIRELPTLSGGELQRLFLSAHIDAQMDSLIYVLDEPTVGLHEIEKQHLLQQLRGLQAQGNSILLVEHDAHLIASADHIIDIGPLAGSAGGEVVYQGNYCGLLAAPGSLTGQYLSGCQSLPCREKIPTAEGVDCLKMANVSTNNLRGMDIHLPLGRLVGVAGVSGSGKSSLVMKTLVPLLERHFLRRGAAADEDAEFEAEEGSTVFMSGRLEGCELLRGFSAVSQQPIGRHDNSNPATYLKIWDPIRRLFAASPEAQEKGLTPGHFSFNADGACPRCSGSGKQRLWLGGAFFTSQNCPECKGKRFQADVSVIHYHGKTILDILEMPAADAVEFFFDQPAITRVLDVLVRSGMGYLPLGQPAPSLSGGEAQRIKLAFEISRTHKSHWLYILDEPTIGLSLYDTGKLMQLLDELILKGSSVLVIEHDPSVLSRCDWIIELGPGGGSAGGALVAAGTPAELQHNPQSIVGPYLHG